VKRIVDIDANHLSKPVILVSLAATLIGTYAFWKLLEELHHRGIYTIGRYRENGQYSDTSLWVFYGLVVFFCLLIAVVFQRTRTKK
jgi:hypothetical protein